MNNPEDFTPVVGEGATLCGWTDRKAFTIVRLSETNPNIFWMRRDKAKLLNGVGSGHPKALEFAMGGFFGHTSGFQVYEYEPTDGPEVRVSMTKRGWRVGGARGSSVIAGRHEYYDFNF